MRHGSSASDYWSGKKPRLFGHRGLSLLHPENSLEAFQHALAEGADYLELDVQASRDGIAVVAHDPDLKRVAGIDSLIRDLSWDEISELRFPGGEKILHLELLLDLLPQARLNIDVKDIRAAEDTARAVHRAAAHQRVLLTSFSKKRRLATLRALEKLGYQGSVATSASATETLMAVILLRIGLSWPARRVLRKVDAMQIPERILGIRTDTATMISRFKACGVEVHFWTINDPKTVQELLHRGADGIVTDRVDLMRE